MPKENKFVVNLIIDDDLYENIAKWPKVLVDGHLSRFQNIEFDSRCLLRATVHRDFIIGKKEHNNQLNIELDRVANSDMLPCIDRPTRWPDISKKCFNSIKSGKCVDPFVIEHIGKIFFADKYNKQK